MKNIAMPNGCQIVAAMNPPTGDYSGTIDFDDKAFQDRFVHVKFQPSFNEFYEYQNSKYTGSGFLAYLQEDDKMLRHKGESFDIADFVVPSPRSWETAFKLEQIYDSGEVERGLFQELMFGIVGREATLAGMAYKDTHVAALKGKDLIEKYHLGDTRAKLLKAKEKNRSDMIGTAIQQIDEEFEKRDSLTDQEARNIITLTADLPAEAQYTLLIVVTKRNKCTWNCGGFETIDGGTGLGHSKELVAIMQKTLKARDEAEKEMAVAKEKKNKSNKKVKKEEEV
jgi:hypothetical protein